MLLRFRDRCGFVQFMPNKPDAKTHYYYNASSYLGKGGGKSENNLGAKVVKDLVKPILNSGQIGTCD